jgi:hypothetical protein
LSRGVQEYAITRHRCHRAGRLARSNPEWDTAGFDPTDFNRWLRQRRAIRASQAGRSDYRRDDFYDDYGHRIMHDPGKYRIALRWLKVGFGAAAVLIAVVVVSLVRSGGSGDPDVTTTTASATTTTTSLAPTTTTIAAIDLPTPVGDAVAHLDPTPGQIRRKVILDVIRDHIDSRSDRRSGYNGGDIDIVQAIVFSTLIDRAAAIAVFNNSVYECGATAPTVVCPPDVLDMPAGNLLVVAVEHDAPVPTASTDRSYIYSVVFDSDGDAANDWVFNPPFDWDFFIGTDRWYQASYSHASGTWQMNVVQVHGDQSTQATATAARAVIVDEWVIWFIPANEFSVWPPPMRATAFAHDGSFGEATRGGDVTGADPTEPLESGFDP